MADLENEKTLRKIADAFKELAATVNSQTADMEVAPFSSACSFVSPLFGCLGIAFKFAEMDYVSKVDDLAEASKSIATLNAMLDRDIEGNCVRKAGSHTRNLLRVKRGLDMVKVLFEQILATDSISITFGQEELPPLLMPVCLGEFLKRSSFQGLYTGICTPPWVGNQESCSCRDVCPPYNLLKKLNEDGEWMHDLASAIS
ncbi:hypothetical protein CRYUN_Cryun18bG0140000 [Craigia yunnanensis]